MLRTRNLIYLAAAAVLLFAGGTPGLAAETAKDKYLSADACYRKLLKNADRVKYRDNWQRCIRGFEDVYRHAPDGPWAAAGLYMSGKLYLELYGHSYLGSDKREALDIFNRVVKRYPKSLYRQRAQREIAAVSGAKTATGTSVKRKAGASPASAGAAAARFRSAEACYRSLSGSAGKRKHRDQWLRCIGGFEEAYDAAPAGTHAAESLYMAGRLYEELFRISYRKADKLASLERYDRVMTLFPDSGPGRRAAEAMGGKADAPSPGDGIAAIIEKNAMQNEGEKELPEAGDGRPALVEGLRYWSNPSYTRVVIDADRKTGYTHRLLKKDPAINKPQRLYVDLAHSRLGEGLPKTIPINDDLLLDARAGQYSADEVRVVVDINSFKTYKIFSLRNPFRIVIDVWGETHAAAGGSTPASIAPGTTGKSGADDLARQLALGVSRIVVDPGHGGKDFGAPGYLKGVHEKHVVLAIARKLAARIRQKLGAEVIMTRDDDRYLTLEERTAFANTKNADLFISIHTNSARSRNAYGIETYFLNLATDDDAILVAARENATSRKNISDLQTILSDLMQNAKINESSRLAGIVQHSLHGHMRQRYSKIRNKGVKQAPFYVLLGAQMPAILVETSFISNPRECRRLMDAKYQEHLCDGIVEGIRRYIREINPTALASPPGGGRSDG